MTDPAPDPARPTIRTGLTDGPIVRTLLTFALPAFGSNVLQSANSSINAMWVGRFLGGGGVAATANASIVILMMLTLVFGFGMAATIMIGQHMGRGDITGVRKSVGTGFTLFAILGSLASALGWLIAPRVLQGLGSPADIFPWALGYLRVMFVGLPFALATIYLAMALRGIGNSMAPLLLQIPGMVVDIVLNPVLIDGWFGAPRLGIEGAAAATLVANLVSFATMIGFIYARDLPIRLRGREFAFLRPDWQILALIVRKGVPMGLQMVVVSTSALFLLGFVNGEGTASVAAYGASTQIWNYVQMPAAAIAMAVSTMAAQNIGAGRWDRIEAIARAGIVIAVAMTVLFVATVIVFDRQVLGLFLPTSPEALAIARRIGWQADWSFVLIAATLVMSSVTRANGAAAAPLVIMAIAYFPGRVGMILLCRPFWGAQAIWWSFSFGSMVSLVLTLIYYRRGTWRAMSMLGDIAPHRARGAP